MTDAPRKNPAADRAKKNRSETALEMIRVLALELHPEWRQTLVVGPNSDLERDLGFDSLARAELVLRLNRELGIQLPDQIIADAATAADICVAVQSAAPGRMPDAHRPAPTPIALAESAAPEAAATLVDALDYHVRAHPERPHAYHWKSIEEQEPLTYGELDLFARIVAHGLAERGVGPGARVAIMLPTGLDYFKAFFGTLYAGAIPVPIYPPFRRAQIEDHMRRQARILSNADATLLLTDQRSRQAGGLLYALVASLKGVHTVAELLSSVPLPKPVAARGSDTALIQYTSGSTGDPKGVVLTHANLLANIRAMGNIVDSSSRDIFVSWLPLYHDMGLIGNWLGSLYFGAPAYIMSPLTFIADPARWLWAIHNHRATISASPNFGFELCLKRVEESTLKGLDLGSLRLLVNGSEPVSPNTIARFTDRFRAYGLSPEAIAPVYGLAENAVGLAFPPLGRLPVIDRIKRLDLARNGVATPADPGDTDILEFVACGQALPGHEVRIVDATGREAPERHEGQLQFRGPSATSGYFRNPEKTESLFIGEWLDSGDRAYVTEGDVYITGRVKDIIIRAGRNIYPHELEECVGAVEGIRKGCVAAFGGTDEATGTEQLIVVAETRIIDPEALEALRRRVGDISAGILEIPPEVIVLAPPRTIPKTSSGKIRRSAMRELYEAGALDRTDRAVWWQLARLRFSGVAHYAWKNLRTAGKLVYAGYWWAVFGILAGILWPLVMILPVRAWRHVVVGTGVRILLAATGIRLTIERESRPPSRDVILVANHASYLDGAIVTAAILGPFSFLVADRFGQQFFAGPFLRRLGATFVGSASSTLREAEDAALKAVRAGERLFVFPEGRLRRMPGLMSFYPGPFLIAAEAAVPVVPVTIVGTRSVLRDSNQWFPRRAPITIRVGKPVMAGGTDFQSALALRDTVRAEILKSCHEPDLAREEIEFGKRTRS